MFPVPDGTCTALVTRKITDCELAVKLYQISSLAMAADAQEGAGTVDVAFTVEAAVGEVQVAPKGFVVTAMAPLQSSLAGACAKIVISGKQVIKTAVASRCKFFFITM
jgi:hypothetical protein